MAFAYCNVFMPLRNQFLLESKCGRKKVLEKKFKNLYTVIDVLFPPCAYGSTYMFCEM